MSMPLSRAQTHPIDVDDDDDDDGDGHGYFKDSRSNTANGRWSLDSNKNQNGQMELMQWMMDL